MSVLLSDFDFHLISSLSVDCVSVCTFLILLILVLVFAVMIYFMHACTRESFTVHLTFANLSPTEPHARVSEAV